MQTDLMTAPPDDVQDALAAARLEQIEEQLGQSLRAARIAYEEIRTLLREIRDARLYSLAGFDTFDTYCAERWELTRRHVDRLILWDEVAENTKAAGLDPPRHESHARELADLAPEIQAEIWKEATETADDSGVSARHVRATRERMLGRKSPLGKREDAENSRGVLTSSESNEWYTPEEYTDAVRDLFGGNIDLDPASCAEANKWIQAGTAFTIDDDGLTQDWFGRVFSNPPNGKTDDHKSQQGEFCDRMVEQYRAGNVVEGVLFVNASTGAVWFRHLFDWPICFIEGRPKHVRPKDNPGKDNPTHYRAFVYVGPAGKWAEFVERFERFGYVHTPRELAAWAEIAAARSQTHQAEE